MNFKKFSIQQILLLTIPIVAAIVVSGVLISLDNTVSNTANAQATCGGTYSYTVSEKYCNENATVCNPRYLPDCEPIPGEACQSRTVTRGGLCGDAALHPSTPPGGDMPSQYTNDQGYKAQSGDCVTPLQFLNSCQSNGTNLCSTSAFGGGATYRLCPTSTTPPPSSTQTCEEYSSYPTLYGYHHWSTPRYDSHTAEVKELQNSLMYLGYPLPIYGADGWYGTETETAVSQFKSANGLGSDGTVFDTAAWNVLEAKVNAKVGTCGSTTTQTVTYTLEMRAKVRNLDGTVVGLFQTSGTGITLDTCLGSGVTTFRKTSNSVRNGCSISAPSSTPFNGKTYIFSHWLKKGITVSEDPNSSIDVDDPILVVSAIAHYQEPGCGNWIVESGETCDDGNNVNGDGCSAACQIERTPICPNGIVESPDTCDDGNTTNGDGCSSTCQTESSPPICGDGAVNQSWETCDGTTNCTADCNYAECVDGSDNDGDLATDSSDTQCDEDCALTDTCGGGNGGCTGDGCGPCVGLGCDDSEDEETPVVWITATPKVVARGGTTLLDWGTDSTGAVTCTSNSDPDDTEWADDAIITQEGPGEGINITLDITGITTFSITCINSELEPGSASVDVVVLTIKEVRP